MVFMEFHESYYKGLFMVNHYISIICLVVWNMVFIFHFIYGILFSLTNSYFSRWLNHRPDMYILGLIRELCFIRIDPLSNASPIVTARKA